MEKQVVRNIASELWRSNDPFVSLNEEHPIEYKIKEIERVMEILSCDFHIIPKKSVGEDFIKMAKDYAMYLDPDDKANRTMIEMDSLGYLNWVLREYFMTPKSKVKDYYKSALNQSKVPSNDPRDAREIEDARSQLLVLENIFDKDELI